MCPIDAIGVTDGKMLAARASANTVRAGAGTAFSPNAGTKITVGVARAHARPSATMSTPPVDSSSTTTPRKLGSTPRRYPG